MTKTKQLLTVENIPYLLECFDTSRIDDGVLIWKKRPLGHFKSETAWRSYNSRVAGTHAGRKARGHLYQTLAVKDPNTKQTVYVNKHRLIWLLKHNEVPPPIIDHKNRITIDNRPSNLRAATDAENRRNSIKSKASPGKGEIVKSENGKFLARFIPEGGTGFEIETDHYILAYSFVNYLSYLADEAAKLDKIQ
ncbi:HNH endonuclease signature motif containing protein [Defluviimonas sp. D31]|uniref:HNH endonuclease signature motif containing protein n=1 Tax=Defluviimonas sp. D31 TaxID=3083253 RepID=UPI00296F343A|nr:HNH endonuclease signature motif containing protein [Defluviimonas sp. D31]MDW4548258.1 HNH endonuclease signature motif containing protein [Defluviimonas sp. D31]